MARTWNYMRLQSVDQNKLNFISYISYSAASTWSSWWLHTSACFRRPRPTTKTPAFATICGSTRESNRHLFRVAATRQSSHLLACQLQCRSYASPRLLCWHRRLRCTFLDDGNPLILPPRWSSTARYSSAAFFTGRLLSATSNPSSANVIARGQILALSQ